MELIDTHCHLASGRLRGDLPGVLDRARRAGVAGIVCAAADVAEARAASELAGRHADIWCTAGIHPHYAKDAPAERLRAIESLAAQARNVAVGEIGLDYHYNYSPPLDQRRVFGEQLALAVRLGKRIVIHTREAFDDTLAIVRDSRADGRRIVFHSFTEGPDALRAVLDLGAMVSFSGIVTFRNASELRQAAQLVPEDRLLIETDAPFLSPEPVRKMKTNEPANVAHVAACLADLRGASVDAIAESTTANARRFFQLDLPGRPH